MVPRLPRHARWTERAGPKGWRCMTCHPPPRPDTIRREGQGATLALLPPDPPDDGPLFGG
jgi:hypothetical protein